jgi:pentatricopeptide repeat protein
MCRVSNWFISLQCFVIYLNALAKSGEAEKAEQVLHRIENLLAEEKSFEINNYGYNLGECNT